MSETQIPSLDELLEKIRKLINDPDLMRHQESFEAHFALVASGRVGLLRDNNAMFAAQCVLVLLEHVRQLRCEKGIEVTE